MAQYPVLSFLERYGDWVAGAISSALLAAGIIAVALGATLWWIAAAALGSIVLYVAARSYVELIRLMTDMLMPK
jgi:hypothetical protein